MSYKVAYNLMEEIYRNFSEEDKTWFQNEVPVATHSKLGRHLRNHAKLWDCEWEPELVDGVDFSPNHPDAISSRVISDFQQSINN